jgi:hypothetical protein
VKDSFYKELEHVFDKFSKCHMKLLLQDFNARVNRENTFKQTNGNESFHKINIDNWNFLSKLCNIQKSDCQKYSSHITFINLLGHAMM